MDRLLAAYGQSRLIGLSEKFPFLRTHKSVNLHSQPMLLATWLRKYDYTVVAVNKWEAVCREDEGAIVAIEVNLSGVEHRMALKGGRKAPLPVWLLF